ncbi:hypothetical protein ARNL5_03825 [Anaerolineae bacterium]|nr:hypothetical protein ARNL5_03825 [Anaerolineae bacterium]
MIRDTPEYTLRNECSFAKASNVRTPVPDLDIVAGFEYSLNTLLTQPRIEEEPAHSALVLQLFKVQMNHITNAR